MEKLVIGIVRKTHGVKGYLKISSTSGETKHFFPLKQVEHKSAGRLTSLDIEDIKPFGRGELLIKFRGYDTPEHAARLALGEILVPREQAAPLGKGEFYQKDLIGCRIVSGGEVLGEVTGVSQGAQSDLLEVKTGNGVFLVPFLKQYIGEVDPDGGTIELLAEWLLQ